MTLGRALNELNRNSTVVMHPALKEAFTKLYGYTSNAEGVRHALLDEFCLDFECAGRLACVSVVHVPLCRSGSPY
jgi:hypothetical protein